MSPTGPSASISPQAATQLPVQSPTQIPSSPTAATAASPGAGGVTVRAVNGNIFIRRGPDLAFNPIAVLRDGHSAAATGRDALTHWLQITVVGVPQAAGWISIVSAYTSVTGDVRALPEIPPSYWPEPAFLRNCTHDEMAADPGGIIIPAVDNFPVNDVRVNPGTYTIRDLDVDGYPEVLTATVGEGSAVDIRIDGNGQKKKCPAP